MNYLVMAASDRSQTLAELDQARNDLAVAVDALQPLTSSGLVRRALEALAAADDRIQGVQIELERLKS